MLHADVSEVADERLAQWRDLVDARLGSVWHDADQPRLAGLREALDYSLLAPGKRVRPILVLATLDACGGDTTAGLDIAVAFELVHAYSLVHDDLPCMDDDDLRRGIPTSHRRFGEGVAVLVGDALQAEAFRLVADATVGEATSRLAIVAMLARAAGWAGMVGGQYLDVIADHDAEDAAGLRALHDMKTGALISACVEAGALLAGAPRESQAACAQFGRELGWLFQLVDDLLDVEGSSDVTGKPAGTDQRHGKVTALEVFGLAGTRAAADEQLARCLEIAATLPDGGGTLPGIARYVRSRDR